MQIIKNGIDTLIHFKLSVKLKVYQFLQPKQYLTSRGLTLLEIQELSMLYPLSNRQFCVLVDEFLSLCGVNVFDEKQNDETISTITMDQMMETVYLKHNPLRDRIRVLYEQDLNEEHLENVNEISFFDFCKCLSVFASDTHKATKIRFAFRIYDTDDNGFISCDNVRDVLQLLIGDKMDDKNISVIVDDTFANCAVNSDGNIEYNEFNSIVAVGDIASNFTIHF
eukprot:517404_1